MLISMVILLFLLLFGILWLIPGWTATHKDPQGRPLQGSIATLESVDVGGQKQWLLIRGVDATNPVVLFLHGGPGTSDMVLIRRYMGELEKHFVVVAWDQRGAGKSYSAIHSKSSMTIDHFLSDVYEMTCLLCQRFRQKKILLVGHSWGSVLGILSVHRHPELYSAYIGVGQIANMTENERLSHEWTLKQAQKANDQRSVKTLVEMGKPPYSGNWQKKMMTQRRLLGKYGGEVYGNSKGAFPFYLSNLMRSTEYSLPDKVNFFRGIFSTVHLVWPELMTINLVKLVTHLKVPIFFALGKQDHEAPPELAEQFFNSLQAPVKKLIWFENSAHLPTIEENKKFTDLLINHVLPVAQTKKPRKFEMTLHLN